MTEETWLDGPTHFHLSFVNATLTNLFSIMEHQILRPSCYSFNKLLYQEFCIEYFLFLLAHSLTCFLTSVFAQMLLSQWGLLCVITQFKIATLPPPTAHAVSALAWFMFFSLLHLLFIVCYHSTEAKLCEVRNLVLSCSHHSELW